MTRISARLIACLSWLCLISAAASPERAMAVPAFAAQTGQPCQTCHVGGFGPQLTPFGRNFKLHGYTQRAGGFTVPFSAFAEASYIRTEKAQPPPPPHNFATNDNVVLDQASLFLAGGFGEHFGAFVQTTYDGVAHAFHWDNLDLRATATTAVAGHDVLLGASLNNSPGVQDSWNTLPAWGFPYTTSTLAPSPATQPLIDGALAQTSLGLTGYAWIESSVYLEGGAYGSPGAKTLTHLGADPTAPGDISGLAPYGRIAWQKMFGSSALEAGAFALDASIHPGLDRTTGLLDHYTDLGLDASWEAPLPHGGAFAVNGRYTHEQQSLKATCALALGGPPGACGKSALTEVVADVSYYWRGWLGATVGGFDTTGSTNPVLYAGNRTAKPDSSGVLLQLDATPFGAASQPKRRANVRVGLQYFAYTRFNGAGTNYDGSGRRASDNNTFRVFSWFAF